MALDSNVSPKTLQSIPEVDAAKCSLPAKNPQDMSLKKVQDDAAIVYAARDNKKASEVADYMRSLKMMTGESPRISLYDMEKFGGSLIEAPEKLLDSCRVIFILLTVNFEHDKHCIYVLHETLADTRLEKDSSDPKKYCVRPLHTQPLNCRDYKTPCGLKSICGFDVHDLHNGRGGQRLLDLFTFNIGRQETVHCHDQQEDQSKSCKEDKSDSGLVETSLVNDYATMGPHTRAMTNGFNPPQSTPGPQKDIRRQGNGMTLRKETSDDNDFSEISCSMEVRHGSGSLKEGEFSCINELFEPPTQNKQFDVPFSDDTNTESSHRLNLSDNLSVDGKRSGFENNICQTTAGNLKNSLDTGDPIDGAVGDPDQTHVNRGGPSDEPDQREKNTDKRDNHPKTGADTVPVEPLVCSPTREPGGNVIGTSNAPKPDKEIREKSLPMDSEDINPGDTSASTNTSDVTKEVQQNSETHDPKIQRCSHLGSAPSFQKADSAHDLGANKDGQLLSTLVTDLTKGTDRKLEVEESSKELPGDSYSADITDQLGDTITEPLMKTRGPGHLLAPLCSSPSSEDRSLFEPQSTKGEDYNTLNTPTQEEPREKPTLHADDVPVSSNQIVPAGQLGGTPSSVTYVYMTDCTHIELSGDVHLVNDNTKTEGSNMGRETQRPKTKKKHGSLALMPRNHETSSGSTCSSTSSPSSTLKESSTEMLTKMQAASVSKVTPQSGLGRSKGDAPEGSRSLSDVIEDASGLPVVESREMKNKISDSCLAQNGSDVDCADKLNSSKDQKKKKSKRKMICFPFLRRRNKKK